MCLYLERNYGHAITFKKSSKFWQRLQKDGKITCWKLYRKNYLKENQLTSDSFNMAIDFPGDVISNRESKKLDGHEKCNAEVNRGIHVFINRPGGYEDHPEYAVVLVVCRKEDFIAEGDYSQAVFMKVEITKRNWDRIFPEKLFFSGEK